MAVNRNRVSLPRQRGLSLIELMVALTIGAFLITGVVNVFLTSKRSAVMENSLARLQENGRFSTDMLRDSLFSAQYLGCDTGQADLTIMAKDISYIGLRAYTHRGDGSWGALPVMSDLMTDTGASGTAPSIRDDLARSGSDVLQVQAGISLGRTLNSIVTSASSDVTVSDNPNCTIDKGDQVIVAACLSSHLFTVTNDISCNPASGSANPAAFEFDSSRNDIDKFNGILNGEYDTDSEILKFRDEAWFVADTGRVRNDTPVYALYRKVSGQSAEEMIEGVEYMRIQLGQRVVNSSGFGDNMRYADPDDAELNRVTNITNGDTNFDYVEAVRIALLIQSFDNVRDKPDTLTYTLLGHEYDASSTSSVHSGGHMIRKVFNSTVALRNPR